MAQADASGRSTNLFNDENMDLLSPTTTSDLEEIGDNQTIRRMPVPDPDVRSALQAIENRTEEIKAVMLDKNGINETSWRRRLAAGGRSRVSDGDNDANSSQQEGAKDSETGLASEDDRVGADRIEAASVPTRTDPSKEKENATDETPPYDDKSISTLRHYLDETQRSLSDHLLRITEPVSVDEYDSYMRNPPIEDEDDEESSSESSSEEELSLSSSSEEEEEYDEEEYLDNDALVRARQLRVEVREASTRVKALRDDVTGRACELAKGELELLSERQNGMSAKDKEDEERVFDEGAYEAKFGETDDDINSDDSDEEEEDADDKTNKNSKADENATKVKDMRTSLRSLIRSLSATNVSLPEKMETLQETMETIEAGLDRNRKLREEGGEDGLPATERAIVSRTNEGQRKKKMTTPGDGADDTGDEEEFESVEPEKRFEMLISHM